MLHEACQKRKNSNNKTLFCHKDQLCFGQLKKARHCGGRHKTEQYTNVPNTHITTCRFWTTLFCVKNNYEHTLYYNKFSSRIPFSYSIISSWCATNYQGQHCPAKSGHAFLACNSKQWPMANTGQGLRQHWHTQSGHTLMCNKMTKCQHRHNQSDHALLYKWWPRATPVIKGLQMSH